MKEDKVKKKRKKYGDGDSSPNEASDSSFINPGDNIPEEPHIKQNDSTILMESGSIQTESPPPDKDKLKIEVKDAAKSVKPKKCDRSSKSGGGGKPIEGDWSTDIVS